MIPDIDILEREIGRLRVWHPVGHVKSVHGGVIRISGLCDHARVGDRVTIARNPGSPIEGEVLQVGSGSIDVLPETAPDGLAVGDSATLRRVPAFAPADHWLGRVIDPFGHALDARPLLPGDQAVEVTAAPPLATTRQPLGARLATGLSLMNTVLPIVQGQRLGLFAGSGVGKSMLLARLATSMQADVVVVALIGERGREVAEFVNNVLGPEGMERAVVVAATSDQSALVRRRCAWAAMSVAEYFRERGNNVLFLADSVTRFAEAHREIAAAGGEAPALRGYPPSITPMITALCERAGPGPFGQGHITAVFSVLVAGSDMDEPVADILRGVLDGHIVLSREIAERGRFPAIDVLRSVSRSLPDAAKPAENALIAETRKLLGAYENAEVMIKAGLYSEGTDPVLDRAVRAWPELDGFFAREDADDIDGSFARLALILRRAGFPVIQPSD